MWYTIAMKIKSTILALVCMSATATRAEWIYNKSTDPLTDNEIHVFLCPPTNLIRKVELQKPVALAINITNGKPTVMIIANPDFTMERTYPVTIRFDRKKAREIPCIISNDRDMLFPIKQREFMEEILSSDGLIISLDALLGHRIDFFDLRGLAEALKSHSLEFPNPQVPAEQSEKCAATQYPAEPPPPDPKAVARATASLDDLANALAYAGGRTAIMPKMSSETSLAKPLASLQKAIERAERAAAYYDNIKKRWDTLKRGNLARPSRNQLARAEKSLTQASDERHKSATEVHSLATRILLSTDWPTVDLKKKADAIIRYTPAPQNQRPRIENVFW